ncbi:MocR-like pyridoxine biosynthesis transcription factor PdxR [Eubacterium sp.]
MKKYIEIYNYYKNLILTNQLKAGDKLPSVRAATQLLPVSKTTIQNAYFELQADGYVVASPKSGYYVTEQKNIVPKATTHTEENSKILYDLKSGDADEESFDVKLWQRYIKSALRQEERLLSYGDVQGEADLREVLSDYIRTKRNVSASVDRIVVGAGVQSLLYILCSLIKNKGTVSFPDKSFVQGINLFADYGFEVKTRNKDADIIYVSPSHMTSYGNVMPIKRRLELVEYSKERGSLVIEDDFDSDFLYQTKPIPSLFALSNAQNIIYMGSFSNVLIPGIRISFMVLTEELANEFQKYKNRFSQTASKTEQIALCQYIRDGHINSQARKVRRLYTAKAKYFCDELQNVLPDSKIELSENGLQVKAEIPFEKETTIFEHNGISANIVSYENGMLRIVFVPSAVKISDIPSAVEKIKSIIL